MWSSLLACVATDPGFGGSGRETEPIVDTAPPAAGVVWREEIGRVWACPEPYLACTADYLDLPERASVGETLTEDQLDEALAAMGSVPAQGAELSEDELAEVIWDAVHPLEEMLDGLADRRVVATVVRRTEFDGYTEEQILVEDPLVGELKAWLLIPDQAVDRAILPLHGHDQWGDSVLDFMGGRDYPAAGYLTMNVTFRVDGADEHEDAVARALMLQGQSFLAIRIYEQVLARHLLADRFPEVDFVGIVGHSGSSVATNLAIRLVPPDAYVSDLATDYADRQGDRIIDHTVPKLHPYADRINDLDRADVPVLVVPYGYEDEHDDIVAFFDAN